MTARQQLDSGSLWKTVDRLTKDTRQKLVRKTPGSKATTEWVPVPCLWTQLVEALASTNSSDGRTSKNTGSRSPLDLAITALVTDMSTRLRAGLLQHGAHPRILIAAPTRGHARTTLPLLDPDGLPHIDPQLAGQLHEAAARAGIPTDTGRLRHDVRSDLRQLATVIVGTSQQHTIDQWTDTYWRWAAQADQILTADDENIDLRGVRGHACPVCLTIWVKTIRDDGGEYRDPALVIGFRDRQVQHITCRACGTGWWRGADVDILTNQIRTNEAVYGDARTWGETRWTDELKEGA